MQDATPTLPTNEPPLHERLGLPADFTSDDLALLPEIEVAALRQQGVLDPIDQLKPDEAAPEAPVEAPKPDAQPQEPAKADAQPPAEPPTTQQQIAALPEIVQFDPSKLRDVPQAEGIDEKLAAAKAELAEARKKFNDMDITEEEFERITEEVAERMGDLRATKRLADEARAHNNRLFVQHWYDSVEAYMAQYPVLRDDKDAFAAFDAHLKRITSDPVSRSLTTTQKIMLAHSEVARTFPAAAASAPTAKQAAAATPQRDGPRTDPRPEPIQTLANVPSASANANGEDRYSSIERLAVQDPDRAIAAYNRMSPEEREAFLNGY